jgi:glutathione synthase
MFNLAVRCSSGRLNASLAKCIFSATYTSGEHKSLRIYSTSRRAFAHTGPVHLANKTTIQNKSNESNLPVYTKPAHETSLESAENQSQFLPKKVKKPPTPSGTSQSATAALLNKQRSAKKKTPVSQPNSTLPSFSIRAYPTAEFYDLEVLRDLLDKTGGYEFLDPETSQDDIPDNCLCVRAKYQEINEIEKRHIFFFESGCVVFWNVSLAEQNSILQMMQRFESSLRLEVVAEESETMQYFRIKPSMITPQSNQHDLAALAHFSRVKRTAGLWRNDIYFLDNGEPDEQERRILLEKFSFSDAICSSVKLGVYENKLNDYIEETEPVSNNLKRGKPLKLKINTVLQNLGKLFTMRHMVNLNSDFLGMPNFYWDREELGVMYEQMYNYFSISKRTEIVNWRLNHCVDLMELVKAHLTDKHHTSLEWIIIGLIALEACIGMGWLEWVNTALRYLWNVLAG